MNVVDSIGADENANSRILAAILSQHDETSNYMVLKSFVGYFFGNTCLADKIDTPVVVTEQLVRNDKRIDIYIHEPGKYAIILENKIMDAPEQPHQLANYIEGLHDFGFQNEQIFIGYLPRTGETMPSEASWTNRKANSYYQEFRPRFQNISFRDGILPWLKQTTLNQNDTETLQLNIRIYIDYLEGLFGFRPNEHYIDMKTDEYIAEKLAYTHESVGDLQKAMDAICQIDNLKREIVRRKREDGKKVLCDWLAKAQDAWPCLSWEDRTDDAQFPSIGFPVSYSGHKRAFKIFIQVDHNHNLIYYGAYVGSGYTMPVAEARDLLRPVMDKVDRFSYALSIKMFTAHVRADEGYAKFSALVDAILSAFG